MPQQAYKNIAATGSANALTVSFNKPDIHALVMFSVGATGAFTGVTVFVQGQTPKGNWITLAVKDLTTGVLLGGTGAFSLTNSTSKAVATDIAGFQAIRVYLNTLSGDVSVEVQTDDWGQFQCCPSNFSNTSNLATAITATSANAFAVGQNGTSNPAFNVNTNTASSATGIQITSAAAGSGVAEAVVSSGTNESLTIDAKGTGTVTINGVGGTGAIQFGGAASGNNATGIKITPAAAASGVAMAVVSTGTNEKLTVDAKGSGQVIVGGTSTGIVSLGRGSTSVAIFSGTKTSIATQNSTPTAAQLLGGYISHASVTGAGTATLDTGANIDTAIASAATGDSFTCYYSNTGSQTVTITSPGGSIVLKGTVAIPSGKVGILEFFRTGSATYDVICTVSS